MPGSGASSRAASIDPRDCGQIAPSRSSRLAADVERRVQDERLGQLRIAVGRDAEVERRRPQRVHADGELGRLVLGRHQRLGLVVPQHGRPLGGDPVGIGVAQRRRQRLHPLRARLGDPPQHGVGEAGGVAAGHRLGQVDRLVDRGAGGYARPRTGAGRRRRAGPRAGSAGARRAGASASTSMAWSSVRTRCTVP